MAEKITKESWDLIVEGIMDVVSRNLMDPDSLNHELQEYLEGEGIIKIMPVYVYGMRLRGFSPGCQPKDGFLERRDSNLKQYWDILVYERKLTGREMNQYSLDYLRME